MSWRYWLAGVALVLLCVLGGYVGAQLALSYQPAVVGHVGPPGPSGVPGPPGPQGPAGFVAPAPTPATLGSGGDAPPEP